jgi:hypothetical protein
MIYTVVTTIAYAFFNRFSQPSAGAADSQKTVSLPSSDDAPRVDQPGEAAALPETGPTTFARDPAPSPPTLQAELSGQAPHAAAALTMVTLQGSPPVWDANYAERLAATERWIAEMESRREAARAAGHSRQEDEHDRGSGWDHSRGDRKQPRSGCRPPPHGWPQLLAPTPQDQGPEFGAAGIRESADRHPTCSGPRLEQG